MSEDPAPLWDAELEVCLFQSMQGHKPVGFNKHFHMICIQHKFYERTGMNISLGHLWDHINSLWNIPVLDTAQDAPFPEVMEHGLYSLPFDQAEIIEEIQSSEDSSSEPGAVPGKQAKKKQK
ncbi:hypothetical protein ACHWQZ_G017722 [Mnemiopsis leidyi]